MTIDCSVPSSSFDANVAIAILDLGRVDEANETLRDDPVADKPSGQGHISIDEGTVLAA